jgi:hypothetical protein
MIIQFTEAVRSSERFPSRSDGRQEDLPALRERSREWRVVVSGLPHTGGRQGQAYHFWPSWHSPLRQLRSGSGEISKSQEVQSQSSLRRQDRQRVQYPSPAFIAWANQQPKTDSTKLAQQRLSFSLDLESDEDQPKKGSGSSKPSASSKKKKTRKSPASSQAKPRGKRCKRNEASSFTADNGADDGDDDGDASEGDGGGCCGGDGRSGASIAGADASSH